MRTDPCSAAKSSVAIDRASVLSCVLYVIQHPEMKGIK